MHLLAVQPGVIDDGSEAIDLAQEPGDIVVLSAADTELAALAGAREALGDGPSLRLANLMQLAHNMSVDVYVEKTLAHAKLVVLRLLGGAAYWPYGLDQVAACCRDNGIALAVLPGDARPDPDLTARSTLAEEDCVALWRYLVEGGPENAANFLRRCFHLIGKGEAPPPARPLVKAGLYWPGMSAPSLNDIRAALARRSPRRPDRLLPRASGGGEHRAGRRARRGAAGRRAQSPARLRLEPQGRGLCGDGARLFAEAPPAVILNATGFAVAGSGRQSPGRARPAGPAGGVLGIEPRGWLDSMQGLSARDLAMNVVLPELDGRMLARAVSFKSSAERHAATQCNIVSYRPNRTASPSSRGSPPTGPGWARPRRPGAGSPSFWPTTPTATGGSATASAYDTPASTVAILDALKAAGYRRCRLSR
jgi:cobaltochelatase CobN